MVINVLRKPVLIGPIESDIVKVRDMSEKATENKVYCWTERWENWDVMILQLTYRLFNKHLINFMKNKTLCK